ncbi:MAG: LuxR C-terminal-related transcriptional regulator [Bacteroidota bacterium]
MKTEMYHRIVNLGIKPEEDYAEIRKIRFLNFTCSLSILITVFAGVFIVLKGNYLLAVSNLVWSIVLGSMIYLNKIGKVYLARYLFNFIWVVYVLLSVFYLGKERYADYYFLITILTFFIFFDRFWVQIVAFIVLLFLFLQTNHTFLEITERSFRYLAFFGIVAFFKTVILETEETIRIKHRIALEAERKRAEEQQERAELELSYKNEELVNFALQITQKNEFIESLNQKIESIKKHHPIPELKELEEVIRINANITEDREAFENHVQLLCEGFFSRLSQSYSGLSVNDKRLAVLIRLNLSSKEISSVLNISPKSVDMSRYRLRKKMNLDSGVNLKEALDSI